MTIRLSQLLAGVSLAALAACGGNKDQAAGDGAAAGATSEAGAGAAAAGGEQTPDAGGKVIAVEMTTDAQGNNVFIPADFEAKQGDVIRYTLGQGVHNVHFLADSNPGKSNLPKASDMLQLSGQTYDVKVAADAFAPGVYYYQCDPHALLGMKGHVTVAAK